MLIQVNNKKLTEDKERTYLTASAAAGDTTLTVKAVDTNSMADNDYLVVGEIGSENAEVMQINGSVSDGTSLTIDNNGSGGLRFNHAVNEPVYRIDYNRIEFNHNSTDTTTGVSVLATNEIQPDDLFTRYEDSSNSTGFAFVRWNNQNTGGFSEYSDGIPYAGQSARSLAKLRAKVRTNLNEMDDEFVTDDQIDEALNDKQREIAHDRFWSFYEVEKSLSTVADQFAYDLPSSIRLGTIHTVTVDTTPLPHANRDRWNRLHWDTDHSSSDPQIVNLFDEQMKFYPRPSSSASTTTLNGAVSAGDTTITVVATSSFTRGDYYRFIINSEVIYATEATATTFTGCLRGREGTTDAAHSDSDTVTERDIVFTGQDEPDDLVDVNDETKIPEPIVLADGATADLATKLGRQNVHDTYIQRYNDGLEKLRRRFTIKFTGAFSVVKDARMGTRDVGSIHNPNNFPQNLSG